MPKWTHSDLAMTADYLSPAGVAEIRGLISTEAGGMSHVRVPAGMVSTPGWHRDVHEFFYITSGAGELWRKESGAIRLRRGMSVDLPPGMPFQYRSDSNSALEFIVIDVPRWFNEAFEVHEQGRWRPTVPVATEDTAPPILDPPNNLDDGIVAMYPDDLAPDGSEIRHLSRHEGASLSHCQLVTSSPTIPIYHSNLEELWLVLAGSGAIWMGTLDNDFFEETLIELLPGRCVYLPSQTAFQFRSSQSFLQLLILTLPAWPGPQGAQSAQRWYWPRLDMGT